MKNLYRAIVVLSAVSFIAFCTVMGASDRENPAANSPEHASFIPSPGEVGAKAHRDVYGNLVAMQSNNGYPWLYSGPDGELGATRKVMARLRQRCPKLNRNWSAFDKVSASYSVLRKVEGLEEFTGMRLVMIGFNFKAGALQEQDLSSASEAEYIVLAGSSGDVSTSKAGALLCGIRPATTFFTKFALSSP